MAPFFIKRASGRINQPSGAVSINWSSEFSKELRWAILPHLSAKNIVNPSESGSYGATNTVIQAASFGISFEGTRDNTVFSIGNGVDSILKGTAGGQSILYVGSCNPRPFSPGYDKFLVAETGNQSYGISQSASGDWRFGRAGATGGFQNMSELLGVYWSFTEPVVSYHLSNAPRIYDTPHTDPFSLVDIGRSRGTVRRFKALFLYGRELEERERQELIKNPWQLFAPSPSRFYLIPTSPVLTIPTLSAPGVTDITATAARPQVTLTY